MRTLRDACINGEADLSTGPSVNGPANRKEGTELTGENLDAAGFVDDEEMGE